MKKLIFVLVLIIFLTFKILQVPSNNINEESNKKVGVQQEKSWYTDEDFNIKKTISGVDYNGNGKDDYQDILEGARADALNKPDYDPTYVVGGYPNEDKGVCTDVVWRAFKNAGYNLKAMVDKDIARDLRSYERVEGKPDRNIDFRRVPNLDRFFSKYAQSLTIDSSQHSKWQGGDIIVFGTKHIGIVSDRRNSSGQNYIIHNYGQKNREEDNLEWGRITAHYRFNAEKISKDILISIEN